MSRKKRNTLIVIALPAVLVLALLIGNYTQGIADNPEPPPSQSDPYEVEMTCSSLLLDGVEFSCNGGLNYSGGTTEISADVYHGEIDGFYIEELDNGTFSLDEDYSSYVELTSQSADGDPFFPADATVYLHLKFTDSEGNVWTADEPTAWVLQHDATEFPVTSNWDTELDDPVTFSKGGETFTLQSSSATGVPQ